VPESPIVATLPGMVLGKPCLGAADSLETYHIQGLHLIENGNAKVATVIGVSEAKAGREAERRERIPLS
jgi:hypothetical protein